VAKGWFIYTQVITDNTGYIYDPRKFYLCDLCKEIIPIDHILKAKDKLSGRPVNVCAVCYVGPMVVH